MLAGKKAAETSGKTYGCTFQSDMFEFTLGKSEFTLFILEPRLRTYNFFPDPEIYRFWDTPGLNEGDQGTVPAERALFNLHELVQQLSAMRGGVNLLVYCIRGTRLRDIVRVNYHLFWGIICQCKVPIVLVITGLELEENMDRWWKDNEGELEAMGMKFDGHACITTTKGKTDKTGVHIFEEEFKASEAKVRKAVQENCAQEPFRLEGQMEGITKRSLRDYMFHYNQRTGQESEVLKALGTRGQSTNQRGPFDLFKRQFVYPALTHGQRGIRAISEFVKNER